MSFIKRFLGKEAQTVTVNDVQAFIDQHPPVEENVNLDYKAIPSMNIDYDELAKDVSAFANSEGGLLMFGISEEPKKIKGKMFRIHPGAITWASPSLSRERIEQRLVGRILPVIDGLKIVPIRKSDQELDVIFLIDVPKSSNPPHMAMSELRYYRRLNFQNRPMTHYVVQTLFRLNWTMKEKLIEKIYEPLSQVLAQQIESLTNHSFASKNEFADILANAYYAWQMSPSLREELDFYTENLDRLADEYTAAKKAVKTIFLQIFTSQLGATFDLNQDDYDVTVSRVGTATSLNRSRIEDYLFKRVEADKVISIPDYNSVAFRYNNKTYDLNPDQFSIIWNNCVQQVSKNEDVTRHRNLIYTLIEQAHDLIDTIISS